MQVIITGRHFDLHDSIKVHAEKELSKLTRFHDHIISVNLILAEEKYRQIAELNVTIPGEVLTGREESDDMFTSIDQVVTTVRDRIKKHKSKLKDHKGRNKKRRVPVSQDGFVPRSEPQESDE